MARKSKRKSQRKTVFVLGDGQTEQYYFDHLKNIHGYSYKIRPRLFNNLTIESAENHIDQLLSGDADLIFYITDLDIIINQNKQSKFQNFIRKYKNNQNVLILGSMPSIEYWFILHFYKTTKRFRNSSEAEKELSKKIKDYSKQKGFLENPKWVEALCEDNNLNNAIKRAKEVLSEKNSEQSDEYFPFTKIHNAIEHFEKLKFYNYG